MNKHPDQFRDMLPPDEVVLEPSGQFGEDLRNFGAAVHRASERQTLQPVAFGWLNGAKRRQRTAQRQLVLAWSLAALLFASALPLLHHSRTAVPAPVTQADDTALLEQVDVAVSESVPSSLAPLEALDNGSLDNLNTTTSTHVQTALNKPEKKHVSQ